MKAADSKSSSRPTCLVCDKVSDEVFKRVGKYTYYRCKACSGVFVYPVEPQSFYLETETYLQNPELYVGRIDPYGQRWMIEQFERLHDSILGYGPRGSYFEIGAGVGYMTLMALARGWQAKGIEAGSQAAQLAREMYRVDILQSTLEDYPSGETFDAVAMVEVLEHFIDPLAAIKDIRRLSGPHTLLFGTTPNTDSEHWRKSKQNIYVPEDHIFLFNEKSIRLFADKADIKDFHVELFGSGELHDSNIMYAGVISS